MIRFIGLPREKAQTPCRREAVQVQRLARLARAQVVLLVVVEVGWHVARIGLPCRHPVRPEMAAVPLADLDQVDVLETGRPRFQRIEKIAQQGEIVGDQRCRIGALDVGGEEDMGGVVEAAEPRAGLRAVEQVDGDVCVVPCDVGPPS
jgi:hypothetical protein